MSLTPTKRFALEKYSDTDSWLLDSGKRTRTLRGLHIEDQYQLGTHALVFIGYDCPFEEVLHIYLLTPEYCVLDQETLGLSFPMGSPGIYQRASVISPTQIEFSFQGTWRLTVGESGVDFDRATLSHARGNRRRDQRVLWESDLGRWLRPLAEAVTRVREQARRGREYAKQQKVLLLEEVVVEAPPRSNSGVQPTPKSGAADPGR